MFNLVVRLIFFELAWIFRSTSSPVRFDVSRSRAPLFLVIVFRNMAFVSCRHNDVAVDGLVGEERVLHKARKGFCWLPVTAVTTAVAFCSSPTPSVVE